MFCASNPQRTLDQLESGGLEFQGTIGSDGCHTYVAPGSYWYQLVDPEDPQRLKGGMPIFGAETGARRAALPAVTARVR